MRQDLLGQREPGYSSLFQEMNNNDNRTKKKQPNVVDVGSLIDLFPGKEIFFDTQKEIDAKLRSVVSYNLDGRIFGAVLVPVDYLTSDNTTHSLNRELLDNKWH